jgi:hypothetical protein
MLAVCGFWRAELTGGQNVLGSTWLGLYLLADVSDVDGTYWEMEFRRGVLASERNSWQDVGTGEYRVWNLTRYLIRILEC